MALEDWQGFTLASHLLEHMVPFIDQALDFPPDLGNLPLTALAGDAATAQIPPVPADRARSGKIVQRDPGLALGDVALVMELNRQRAKRVVQVFVQRPPTISGNIARYQHRGIALEPAQTGLATLFAALGPIHLFTVAEFLVADPKTDGRRNLDRYVYFFDRRLRQRAWRQPIDRRGYPLDIGITLLDCRFDLANSLAPVIARFAGAGGPVDVVLEVGDPSL